MILESAIAVYVPCYDAVLEEVEESSLDDM